MKLKSSRAFFASSNPKKPKIIPTPFFNRSRGIPTRLPIILDRPPPTPSINLVTILSPSDSLKPSIKPVIRSNADITIVTGKNSLPNTLPKPFANDMILPIVPPLPAIAAIEVDVDLIIPNKFLSGANALFTIAIKSSPNFTIVLKNLLFMKKVFIPLIIFLILPKKPATCLPSVATDSTTSALLNKPVNDAFIPLRVVFILLKKLRIKLGVIVFTKFLIDVSNVPNPFTKAPLLPNTAFSRLNCFRTSFTNPPTKDTIIPPIKPSGASNPIPTSSALIFAIPSARPSIPAAILSNTFACLSLSLCASLSASTLADALFCDASITACCWSIPF